MVMSLWQLYNIMQYLSLYIYIYTHFSKIIYSSKCIFFNLHNNQTNMGQINHVFQLKDTVRFEKMHSILTYKRLIKNWIVKKIHKYNFIDNISVSKYYFNATKFDTLIKLLENT